MVACIPIGTATVVASESIDVDAQAPPLRETRAKYTPLSVSPTVRVLLVAPEIAAPSLYHWKAGDGASVVTLRVSVNPGSTTNSAGLSLLTVKSPALVIVTAAERSTQAPGPKTSTS